MGHHLLQNIVTEEEQHIPRLEVQSRGSQVALDPSSWPLP